MRRSIFSVLVVFGLFCFWSLSAQFIVNSQTTNTLNEGFEAGGKPAYAAGNITLGSGSWFLDDTLTGNTTSDHKNGAWSARVRNTGRVRMNFDIVNAGMVTIQHAVYGSDGVSTWELWNSTDGGKTWSKVGSTITTSSPTLNTAGFTVNSASAIRFEIRKITGGADRLNIDDIIVAPFTTSTPTPTPTPSPTPTPTPVNVCTPFTTVSEGDLFPGGIVSFGFTGGQGSVLVDHVNAGTGLQSLTVIGTPVNAIVSIPAYPAGTYNPVLTTFTPVNPNLAIDFTLRAASTFHAANVRVRCLAPPPTPTPTPTPIPSTNVNLTMGNPSNAVTDINQPTNYLMEKPQYVLSYNRDQGRPNWTSWHLDTTWIGSTPRQNDFRPDPTLPANWYHVTTEDYIGSGFDRGHMCPSGDRTQSVADNSATFLMTNIIPQASVNNQTTWANMEVYLRTLAASGNELYTISGGSGVSGFIANGNVAVPTFTWKVVMVLPSGTNDVSRVNTSTRLIAVFVPNNNSVVEDWRQYRVSVDSVESSTGFDFFSNVPDSIENIIESTIDTQ